MNALLTAPQAAKKLGISRSLLYALVSEGKLKRVKLREGRPGTSRLREEDLAAFVENRLR